MKDAVILPSNGRSRQIFDINASASGKSIQDIVVENDSITLTCYADSLANNASLNITIEEIGNNAGNVRLLKRTTTIIKASEVPSTETLPVSGIVRITAEYSGAVVFEIHARAVSAAASNAITTQPVELQLTSDDILYRNRQISLLCQIHDKLETILNHQRQITGLEDDIGDKY